jgi:hypothetical protein
MNSDFTDVCCAVIILMSVGGFLYLLNPDFQHFVQTEIQPSAGEWTANNLPTWKAVKAKFMEGYRDGQGSQPRR